jgi:alkylation response protein AidB-like acyl-CoA dehydrogenase
MMSGHRGLCAGSVALASLQAFEHRVADMLMALELADALTRSIVSQLDEPTELRGRADAWAAGRRGLFPSFIVYAFAMTCSPCRSRTSMAP